MTREDVVPHRRTSRRSFLRSAALLGVAASNLRALDAAAAVPERTSLPGASSLPDIQFAINDFIAPAQTIDGIAVRFPPVYTSFTTFTLTRRVQ